MSLLRSHVVIFSAALLFVGVGCRAKTTSSSDDGDLDTSEAALSADNDDSQEAEDDAEDGIEDGLSGAAADDPGDPAAATDLDGVDAKIRTNPGLYFKPAGCITSTRESRGVWTHVFKDCTGPRGRVTFNGTVKSTWTVGPNTLEVKHEATSFTITGKNVTTTFSGSRDVTYTRTGTLVSKHRVGSWSGTLTSNNDSNKSAPWTHQADFTSTWDPSTKCYTRDGSAQNSVGDRQFGRTVSGLKVCGGFLSCPESGELEVDRKDGTVKIKVTFLGGNEVEITGPRGHTKRKMLLCI